jgi:chromosome segregation ATPase
MASESSEERVVSARLPSATDEWLDAKAAELDVDRETVVVQLLSAYRAASELGDEETGPPGDVESEVRDVIAERLPDIASAVSEQVDTGEDVAAVESRLESDIDRVEREFDEKIQDVRERVIQVKKDADAKAPADHSHPELDELDDVSEALGDLDDRLDELADRLDDDGRERESLDERVSDLEGAVERLDEVEDRLQTVAWVVSDLRDAVDDGLEGGRAVDSLKQSAAKADVDRAVCDHCDEPVDIALLSEPRCPHCETAVNDVELPGGLFGKPRLTVAKQLEAGEDDDRDVPDAALRD